MASVRTGGWFCIFHASKHLESGILAALELNDVTVLWDCLSLLIQINHPKKIYIIILQGLFPFLFIDM